MTERQAHPLFDFLMREYQLKNDAALGRALGLSAPSVSKIRAGVQKVSAELKITIHKKTGMSIEDIEEMLGEKNEPTGAQV
jgi:DNA-binding transcriptional regulator YdaS (Cro superfamily)